MRTYIHTLYTHTYIHTYIYIFICIYIAVVLEGLKDLGLRVLAIEGASTSRQQGGARYLAWRSLKLRDLGVLYTYICTYLQTPSPRSQGLKLRFAVP